MKYGTLLQSLRDECEQWLADSDREGDCFLACDAI
jgi:hypothetical protein